MDKLRFQSFASGSSGNCYFIGNSSYGFLIDAGIGVRVIKKNLKALGLEFNQIWGVFVTHDHADHIRAIGSLGEIHQVPVYTTKQVHEGINRSYCVTEKLGASRKYIEKNQTVEIRDFKFTAFEVSHDATDNVGYTVEYKGIKFTFATDLGYVCENAATHLRQADYMVLEANYDENMLSFGKYPADLKRRIRANTGHLSNEQTGRFLADNYNENMKIVFLCHLSKENNMPEKAFATVKRHLENSNIRVGEHLELVTLNRFEPTKLYEFN